MLNGIQESKGRGGDVSQTRGKIVSREVCGINIVQVSQIKEEGEHVREKVHWDGFHPLSLKSELV